MASGLNVWAAIVLFAVVIVMINVISSRHYRRWPLGWQDYLALSPKTQSLLHDLHARIRIIVFMNRSDRYFGDIRDLLQEYVYAASRSPELRMAVEYVDPDRDLVRARELAAEHELKDEGVVIFECEGRRTYVEPGQIFDYTLNLNEQGSLERQQGAFRGEQMFSSAILNVTQARRPIVYMLTGHGERDMEDFGSPAGYSAIVRAMRRDNIEVRSLRLAESGQVPADTGVLIIAGPRRRLSQVEVDQIAQYLDRSGRLLLCVDPRAETGLEDLLNDWGIRAADETVVGLSLTGEELFVNAYGEHPITRDLSRVTTMFYRPRRIEVVPGSGNESDDRADRPRVTVLAACGEDGWAETDPDMTPPRLDPAVDFPGRHAVAVAIERGAVAGIDVELDPTRLVVVGDSSFISNGAMSGGVGGNRDFFMSALNWLLDRDALMALGPKDPTEIHLNMTRPQLRLTYLLIVGAMPGLVALIGVGVWLKRRR